MRALQDPQLNARILLQHQPEPHGGCPVSATRCCRALQRDGRGLINAPPGFGLQHELWRRNSVEQGEEEGRSDAGGSTSLILLTTIVVIGLR